MTWSDWFWFAVLVLNLALLLTAVTDDYAIVRLVIYVSTLTAAGVALLSLLGVIS